MAYNSGGEDKPFIELIDWTKIVTAVGIAVAGVDATAKIYTVKGLKGSSTAILYGNGTQIATATADTSGKVIWTLSTAPLQGTIITYDGIVVGSGGTAPKPPPIPYVGPKLGTYAYNTLNSVKQFFDWIGITRPGSYGDAHIGRGYGKTDFAGAADDWVNSTDYVIQTCGWAGPDHEMRLAMPLICRFGSLADAAAGTYNTYYTQIFTKIKNNLKPYQKIVRIRLGWEFNSTFQEWGTGSDTTKQSNYVTAFRLAVNCARALEDADFAFKFEWVMNPGSFAFIPCYPGDTYVDYIGMDCYPGLNNKNIYRAPLVVSPQAQVGIWDYMRTMQYGMDEARAFADLRGKPFIIPELAIEWDNGQVFFDTLWAWMLGGTNPVESFGWWNDSDVNNVVSRISTGDLPNTGASVRYRFNQDAYPTQPSTPAFVPVNRLNSNLSASAWSKASANATLVSGETDPDGQPVYSMTALNITSTGIKRINSSALCPVNVDVVTRVLVAPNGLNFIIFNGPEGTDTGRYMLDLTTGVFRFYTATYSGTVAQMQAKVSTPVKRGNYWDFTITGKSRSFAINPLLHMQPATGDEQSYMATSTTDGVKFGRVEAVTK